MRITLVVLLVTALFGGVWGYRQERNDRREDVARLDGELSSVRSDLAGTRRTREASAELRASQRMTGRCTMKSAVAPRTSHGTIAENCSADVRNKR